MTWGNIRQGPTGVCSSKCNPSGRQIEYTLYCFFAMLPYEWRLFFKIWNTKINELFYTCCICYIIPFVALMLSVSRSKSLAYMTIYHCVWSYSYVGRCFTGGNLNSPSRFNSKLPSGTATRNHLPPSNPRILRLKHSVEAGRSLPARSGNMKELAIFEMIRIFCSWLMLSCPVNTVAAKFLIPHTLFHFLSKTATFACQIHVFH